MLVRPPPPLGHGTLDHCLERIGLEIAISLVSP
jgi:hypothetical protein